MRLAVAALVGLALGWFYCVVIVAGWCSEVEREQEDRWKKTSSQ